MRKIQGKFKSSHEISQEKFEIEKNGWKMFSKMDL